VVIPWLGVHRLFDVGGAVALVGFGLVFVASAVCNIVHLYNLEPLPDRRIDTLSRSGGPSRIPV